MLLKINKYEYDNDVRNFEVMCEKLMWWESVLVEIMNRNILLNSTIINL